MEKLYLHGKCPAISSNHFFVSQIEYIAYSWQQVIKTIRNMLIIVKIRLKINLTETEVS